MTILSKTKYVLIGLISIISILFLIALFGSKEQATQTKEIDNEINKLSITADKEIEGSISDDLNKIIPADKLDDPVFIENLKLLKNKLDNSSLPSDELSEEEYELAKKLTDDPIAIKNLESMRVRSEFKSYFRSLETLSDNERTVQAKALLDKFNFGKFNGLFLPQEIYSARLSLLSSMQLSEDEMKKAAAQLQEEAKNYAQSIAADGQSRDDQELEIIKEVMDMKEIPDGLTTQEYLDQRIEELHNNSAN